MPHIIKHTFVCDICGFEFPPEERRSESGMSYREVISHPDSSNWRSRYNIPVGFNLLEGKLVCYKHKIVVEHNGDMVTVKEANT